MYKGSKQTRAGRTAVTAASAYPAGSENAINENPVLARVYNNVYYTCIRVCSSTVHKLLLKPNRIR